MTWTAQTLRGNKKLILEITLMVVFTVVALGDVEHRTDGGCGTKSGS
jgi:hypothetical protein